MFTGTAVLPRKQMATLAVEAGCKVGKSVTYKTTLLVVGTWHNIKGQSNKFRKAEEYIEQWQDIKIMSSEEFYFFATGRPWAGGAS